jgi:hypothetical protein
LADCSKGISDPFTARCNQIRAGQRILTTFGNATVDGDSLACSPPVRKSRTGRAAATRFDLLLDESAVPGPRGCAVARVQSGV